MDEMCRLKTRCDDRLRPLSEWLAMEATPVIDGLLKSAVDAVRYLDQKSVEVTTSQTQLEGGRGNLRKLALPGLRVDDASAETQKIINHTTRLKTRINERLDDAKKTQAALQGLCIQDLQVWLETAARECDEMVSRAETTISAPMFRYLRA